MPPPPPFGRSPSPALRAGADKQDRSRGASLRPSFARHHDAEEASCKQRNKEGRRSAERRIVSPIAARAAARPHREARPPSGAPPRHSPPAITPMAQPETRVSARRGGAVFCRHAAKLPCVKYAPYRPVLLPVDRYPRAARERFARPRAGIRTRSAVKIASGMRPSVSEIRRILYLN
jgi:hypothetical protein